MAYGVYEAGGLRYTSVSGSALTGLFAADGSYNVVMDDAVYKGLYHPCGALRVNTTIGTQMYDSTGAYYLNVWAGIWGNLSAPAWVANVQNPPDTFFDFTNNRAWLKGRGVTTATALLTVARSSIAYVNNSAGVWSLVSSNILRRSDLGALIEEQRTNSIRNNSGQGAIPGADNVQLLTNNSFAQQGTGWTVGTAGGGSVVFGNGFATIGGDNTTNGNYISQQVSGLIIGRSYILCIAAGGGGTAAVGVGNAAGSNSLVGFTNLQNANNTTNPANPDRIGFTATATSHWITISRVASSTLTVNSITVSDGERSENGSFTFNPVNAAQDTVQNGWQWRSNGGSSTVTNGSGNVNITGDGTNFALFSTFGFPTINGAAYIVTFDVIGNSLTAGAGTARYSSGTFNAGTVGVGTNNKFQFTATATTMFVTFGRQLAGTGQVANVSIQSAGVLLPTNWSGTLNSGMTATVSTVNLATVNGIDFIQTAVSGTATANTLVQSFDAVAQIAATPGQTWTGSVFTQLLSGSLSTNITTFDLAIREYDSGSVFLRQTLTSLQGASSTVQRVNSVVLIGASTAFVQLSVRVTYTAAAVAFNLGLGWPQLELGASATSPIRTTNAAVTRAADIVTLTSPGTIGSAVTFYTKATPQVPVGYNLFQRALEISDNSTNNTLSIGRVGNSGGGGAGDFIAASASAGVAGTNVGVTTVWAQNASGKLATAATSGDHTLYAGGVIQGTQVALTYPTGLSTVTFGNRPDGTRSLNGFLAESGVWNSQRVPNAQLASMTT